MKEFTLELVTQEKHLGTHTVVSVTVATQVGEITVMAGHIPLFSRLEAGELVFRTKSGIERSFAITGGFIDVSPRGIVTVLADSAIRSEEINLAKAEEAVENAKKALTDKKEVTDTFKVEMELRAALSKARIARKYQKSS